jgi:hypothetical protein
MLDLIFVVIGIAGFLRPFAPRTQASLVAADAFAG